MGCKLHTLLLKNACISGDEEQAFKKVNFLSRWPSIAESKGFSADAAHSLTRTLIASLVSALANEL